METDEEQQESTQLVESAEPDILDTQQILFLGRIGRIFLFTQFQLKITDEGGEEITWDEIDEIAQVMHEYINNMHSYYSDPDDIDFFQKIIIRMV